MFQFIVLTGACLGGGFACYKYRTSEMCLSDVEEYVSGACVRARSVVLGLLEIKKVDKDTQTEPVEFVEPIETLYNEVIVSEPIPKKNEMKSYYQWMTRS